MAPQTAKALCVIRENVRISRSFLNMTIPFQKWITVAYWELQTALNLSALEQDGGIGDPPPERESDTPWSSCAEAFTVRHKRNRIIH